MTKVTEVSTSRISVVAHVWDRVCECFVVEIRNIYTIYIVFEKACANADSL